MSGRSRCETSYAFNEHEMCQMGGQCTCGLTNVILAANGPVNPENILVNTVLC
jgi:hypothetical protein